MVPQKGEIIHRRQDHEFCIDDAESLKDPVPFVIELNRPKFTFLPVNVGHIGITEIP